MTAISVVVPIYNVERYLAACLHSVARQTAEDLEVIMVDDGSTDGSVAIARGFAARDRRFQLVQQANGGLGSARNTGTEVATGDYLAFLDSDDVLPSNAYELLLKPLRRTGSDFATGNVHRLTESGTSQAAFLAKAFTRTRLKTHITRFRPLIADRTAWNKLWRRSFWDAHGLRFPEGVVHEDIPVVLPAHFMASSVDVVADPVYRYRVREDGDALDHPAPARAPRPDRPARRGRARARLPRGPRPPARARWYDERLVADDLRLHLDLLGDADEGYRALFLARVNAMLDTASPRVFDGLAAIDRLKWRLVRDERMPELLEVLRFHREDHARTRPVREGLHWYGAYPFRDDPRIPRSTFRLGRSDPDLALTPYLDALAREDGRLKLAGRACIDALGAPTPRFQRATLVAVRPGRLQRLRLRLGAVRLDTEATRRPEAAVEPLDAPRPPCWSGFAATLDPAALRRGGRWVEGTWELSAAVRAGGLRRRRARFVVEDPRVARAVDLPAPPEISVRATATPEGRLDGAGPQAVGGAAGAPRRPPPAPPRGRHREGAARPVRARAAARQRRLHALVPAHDRVRPVAGAVRRGRAAARRPRRARADARRGRQRLPGVGAARGLRRQRTSSSACPTTCRRRAGRPRWARRPCCAPRAATPPWSSSAWRSPPSAG